ncbi:Fe-S cluster assembly sulfur transfer protein SufU [Sediminicoccus sp. BL-A-41-H5]|uniref:Fe-S cluster assembly sulfur transfer protein SufU n=1 Tax=Sediminicoccus sp. BL-A-41-H5 TaxID=3421106 RepID=UPI003D66C483
MSAPADFQELQDLYSKVLRDLARNPVHRGRLENATASARGDNPMCGDRVDLSLMVADGAITEAMFQGRGCEISQASAALLTELVRGKSPAEARALGEAVARLARGEEVSGDAPELERLAILSVVKKFPSRVKCATLAWRALDAALAGVKETSSE